MEFGISTQIHRRQAVTVDTLESIRRAGFERLELFCNRPHFDFHDRSLMRSIGRWFQENALPAPSFHLPFMENVGPTQKIWISVLEPERRLRETAIDEIKRSLELADHVRPAYVVMHLGNPGESFTPVTFDFAYSAIVQIRAFAGVDVMIENIPNDISTIARIEEFKAVAQLSNIGICYDTGHGHLQGNTNGFEHIQTTHVHDNNGHKDEHLWPFEGTLEWPALIEKLILANYKGPFVFETRGNDLSKGGEAKSRLGDLWDEAQHSIEEFRLKHKL
jgi:sugar phosphate isomerase/epimerase